MSNISKIKISGTSYNLKDENACKVVELTQAQYDDLPTTAKTSNSLFVITDATAGDLSNYYTKSETSGATEISTALNAKADTATTYTKTETDGLLDTKLDVTAYTPTDLSNYYTKSETSGATEISTALASKADTLVSGTNIKTINGESILGEGNIEIQGGGGSGKAISAGTNISITTGETADTINCTLPISAGTGSESIIAATQPNYPNKATANGAIAFNGYGFVPTSATGVNSLAQGDATSAQGGASHSEGYDTKAIGYASHSEGEGTSAMTECSHAEGVNTKATNKSEHASGRYNISVSASTTFGDSGNTLFSVGNGTSNSARHNAFEIRQNGDIYITKDGQDVKLQDQLGGGGSSYTAGDGIDINNDVISVTGKVDTSTYNTYTAATDTALASKQTTLTAGTGISIVDNVISATGGGGGGMTEDDELLLSTALTDLNDRKIDASELKSNYQKKGDYATKNYVTNALEPYETKLDGINTEEVTAYALNDLNNRFGGLSLVKITESAYSALTTKDENTLYIVVADPS